MVNIMLLMQGTHKLWPLMHICLQRSQDRFYDSKLGRHLQKCSAQHKDRFANTCQSRGSTTVHCELSEGTCRESSRAEGGDCSVVVVVVVVVVVAGAGRG